MIYLDNAATTMIKPARVGREMLRAMQTMASPGRGDHAPAMAAAKTVYECRQTAARLFNVPESEQIVFTMNATHGLNIAINSLARAGDKVVISGYEHNSVTRPLAAAGTDIHVAQGRLFDGEAVLQYFEKLLPGAAFAVCTQVSNVFGFALPIYEIAELCKIKNVPLIVDASQAAGVLDVDYKRLGAEFIAMPGHKALYGPQGTGILICKGSAEPIISGGSGSDSVAQQMPGYLPDRLEAGTHNVCGIAGLKAGIEFVLEKGREEIEKHEHELLLLALSELRGTPGLEIFSKDGSEQSGLLAFRSDKINCEELAGALAEKGVCLRTGLHCAPMAHKSAGTLETGTLRMSFSAFTTGEEIKSCCRFIKDLLDRTA